MPVQINVTLLDKLYFVNMRDTDVTYYWWYVNNLTSNENSWPVRENYGEKMIKMCAIAPPVVKFWKNEIALMSIEAGKYININWSFALCVTLCFFSHEGWTKVDFSKAINVLQ